MLGAIRGALRLPVATDKADSKLVEELGLGAFRGASTQARRTTFEDAPPEVEQPHAGSEPAAGGGGGSGKAGPISGDDIGGDFADFEVRPLAYLFGNYWEIIYNQAFTGACTVRLSQKVRS